MIGPLLGQGGMGEVYEAWDTVLARPVALKILRHLEPAAMIRFMHEAQLHARLDLPNICRIYDVDASNGAPRIAMQLVRGPTLEEAAADLRLEEIVSILAKVAEAIHAAHLLKLIHRDLKPSNILLQWHDLGGWVPYICDFGLAMVMDGPAVTQPLAMTGTPAYMAPEQVRGDRSLTCPATDVYGMGSTLYFALVGRPPCVSTVSTEILRVKRQCGFPNPRSLEPEIPLALETILLKCLQPNPDDRYPTALALAEDLWRFQEGKPIAALPSGKLKRVWNWCNRHRLALAVAGACLVLAGGLLAWEGIAQRNQRRRTQLAQYFGLEAANLEQGLSNERILPVHDLRPAFARTRARLEALRQRFSPRGAEAGGPLALTLARTHWLLGDFAAAQAEAEKAWSSKVQTPEAAFTLARAEARAQEQAGLLAAFTGTDPGPQTAQRLDRILATLAQARGATSDPPEFIEANRLFLKADFAQAQELARASLKANPWHLDSAVLESRCHSILARHLGQRGDGTGAEARYREAQEAARSALPRGQSNEGLHHAWCVAALGLAGLALERGDLALADLAELEQRTDQLLLLDPDNPDSQSDWLRVRGLKARRLLDLGQDPRAVLDAGVHFYWTRTREPRTVDLRVDHMELYALQAERDFTHGEDPTPALMEALKDPGHAVQGHRDFYGDLLNLKARVEAAQGKDPRPTVEALLARFQPLAERQGQYDLYEIAAEAWLTRAHWERGHGIDPLTSLRQAQALLHRALQVKPTSAAAHALLGQTQVLEAQVQPENRSWLLQRAQEHQQLARNLCPMDRQHGRLKARPKGQAKG